MHVRVPTGAWLQMALPPAEQALLLECITHHVGDFTAIEISAVLVACSRLGVPWGVQQDALLAMFILHAQTEARQGHTSDSDTEDAAARVPPQAAANIAWAAARGRGLVFDAEDGGAFRTVLERAVRRFNGQEVANVLWALGVGRHQLDGRFARLLQTAARDTAGAMSAQELACTCGGLVKTGMGLGLRDASGGESVWEVEEEVAGGKARRRRNARSVEVAEDLQLAIERSCRAFSAQTAAHISWAVAESGAVLTRPAALEGLRSALTRTAAEAADPMEPAIMLHSAAAVAAAAAAGPQRGARVGFLDPRGDLLRRLCAAVSRTAPAAPAVAVLCSLRALLRLSRLPEGADGGAAAVLQAGGAGGGAVTALRDGIARHAPDLTWRDSQDAAEALVVLGEGVPAELVASMCDGAESDDDEDLGTGEGEVFAMEDMEVAGVSDT